MENEQQIEEKLIETVTIDKDIYWNEISEETQKVLSAKEGDNTVEEFYSPNPWGRIIIEKRDEKYYHGETEWAGDVKDLTRYAVHSQYLQFKVHFQAGEDMDLKSYYIKAMSVFDYFVKERLVHTKMFKQPFTVLINDVRIYSPWQYLLKEGSYEFKKLYTVNDLKQDENVFVETGISAPILVSEELSEKEQQEFDEFKNSKAIIIAIYFFNSLSSHDFYQISKFINMAVGTKVLVQEGEAPDTDWDKVDEFLEKVK